MAYGEKVNITSIATRSDFPANNTPATVSIMNTIQQNLKLDRKTFYNPMNHEGSTYNSIYDNYLPPMLLFNICPSAQTDFNGYVVFIPAFAQTDANGLLIAGLQPYNFNNPPEILLKDDTLSFLDSGAPYPSGEEEA